MNLFEAIIGIENKYNSATYHLPEEDKIATVLDNAPAEYSTVLTCEKHVKGYSLNTEDLQEAMRQMYHKTYGNKVNIDADTYIRLVRND